MDNPSKIISNLNAEAALGNFPKIKSILDKNTFNQKEIDEAFRLCIHNYNKNQKESFINCINLFIKKTPEINYRNSKYNNTTILMYSIDEGKDTPIDLIISCTKDDLDLNLTDFNGENTIFHLINNNKFTQKIKIEFIKDLCLNDFNIYSKNNDKKSIKDILDTKGDKNLLEEIVNKVKENKFDQNKLTSLYNDNNYNDLFNSLENIENQSDKSIELINKNSIKYNKPFIGLKAIINSLNKQVKNEYDFQFILENQKISDLTLEMMDILYKIKIGDGYLDNNNNNNDINASTYSLCLIINKMIMFYQLDYYIDFLHLIEQIKYYETEISPLSIIYNLYKSFINIDMMVQRGFYIKANDEFNKIKHFISNISEKKEQNNKLIKKIILPKDIIFDFKNIKNLFKLYQIYINSYINVQKKEDYEIQMSELKNIKVEEKETNNNQIINIKNDTNIKNFQKLLYLKLNYLKTSDDKIPYKIKDTLGILNITGTNADSQLNKIYFYHYLGIISLKNKKYTISTYFFLKCLNLISKKTSMLFIKRNHFYPVILYNLSLSYFYNKKYHDTIKSLYLLLNYSNNKSKFFINYKYIYYRLGLSNLEILMQENESVNLLYNSYYNKKIILKTSKCSSSSFYEKLDIIEYFKKTFILIKNEPNDPIYFSTLINLVFCLILKENYAEAIFYLKLNKSKDIIHINIIKNYLLQCYIYINKLVLAEKISKEIIFDDKILKYNKVDLKFFEKLNLRLVKTKGYKISSLVNLIKLCVEKKNIKDMQKYLMLILDSINLDISFGEQGKLNVNEEIPTYIINVFVYYYLMIHRKDLALDIIKKRKIKEIIIFSPYSN